MAVGQWRLGPVASSSIDRTVRALRDDRWQGRVLALGQAPAPGLPCSALASPFFLLFNVISLFYSLAAAADGPKVRPWCPFVRRRHRAYIKTTVISFCLFVFFILRVFCFSFQNLLLSSQVAFWIGLFLASKDSFLLLVLLLLLLLSLWFSCRLFEGGKKIQIDTHKKKIKEEGRRRRRRRRRESLASSHTRIHTNHVTKNGRRRNRSVAKG